MQWWACNCKHGCGWCPTLFAQSMDRKWSIVTCYFINLIIMHIVIYYTRKTEKSPRLQLQARDHIYRSVVDQHTRSIPRTSKLLPCVDPSACMYVLWNCGLFSFSFWKDNKCAWEVSVISSLDLSLPIKLGLEYYNMASPTVLWLLCGFSFRAWTRRFNGRRSINCSAQTRRVRSGHTQTQATCT